MANVFFFWRADDVYIGHSTYTYGSDSSVFVSRMYSTYNKSCCHENIVVFPQRFCKAETRDRLWRENPICAQIWSWFLPAQCECSRKRYCLQCEDFYKTLASTAMAGFSMSALLWTILSSSCAGLGLFPGPAISERKKRRRAVERKCQVFGLWLTGQRSSKRVIVVLVNAKAINPLVAFYMQL